MSLYPDELHIQVDKKAFKAECLKQHAELRSPVMTFFANDRRQSNAGFELICVFLNAHQKQWVLVKTMLDANNPEFDSLAKEMYSAGLFERRIHEEFNILPRGNPDLRSLYLHEEVADPKAAYPFLKVEGEGVFEVPVGPVHAGVIGPGHFRFSVAGEPIINLELRLGWTHRGAEKLFESKNIDEAVALSECVSGDQAFSYSLAFCRAIEKIKGITISNRSAVSRALCLELERLYNHATGIAGIAIDVGFSLPAMFCQTIKERLLQLNQKLTGSRYLKNINRVGSCGLDLTQEKNDLLLKELKGIEKDYLKLRSVLLRSVSFLDRVDTTGILRKKTAMDLGVTGMPARASGINLDLRSFDPLYLEAGFKARVQEKGDVLARLMIRLDEFADSLQLIRAFATRLSAEETSQDLPPAPVSTSRNALGAAESWRGPVLFWVELNEQGGIQRCKITDPSFKNWQALSFAVLDNIIPDFPVCNKSFDLSYSGNDL